MRLKIWEKKTEVALGAPEKSKKPKFKNKKPLKWGFFIGGQILKFIN